MRCSKKESTTIDLSKVAAIIMMTSVENWQTVEKMLMSTMKHKEEESDRVMEEEGNHPKVASRQNEKTVL